MNEDGMETTFEKGLYNAMLTLMMLNERGWLSPAEVNSCLCRALSGNLFFGEKNNPGIAKDKAAWAQTIIEQAVGRLCRTRNKPDRKSTRLNSSHANISYAVFCLKKKKFSGCTATFLTPLSSEFPM